jgi:hypothetical protein
MALRPFGLIDSATVAGWAATVEEATMWCGPVPGRPVADRSTQDGVRESTRLPGRVEA